MAMADGDPSWLEIGVPQGSRARAFYEGLFGWRFRDMERDNFSASLTSLGAGAGVGVHPGDDDAVIVVYFAVADIEAAVRRVRELGGTAGDPGPDSEGFGRFVECRDSQGVRFGLRQLPAGQAP